MIALVSLSLIAGAVLIALLSLAADNTAFFAEHFTLLLSLTAVAALALIGLIGYQAYVLIRRIRAGVFGAKLTARLLLVFALMALVPGAIVYTVSVQFLTRSIESWFDVRMERALQGGLSLGQSALEHVRRDLVKKAESMAVQLAEMPPEEQAYRLNELRETIAAQEAALYDLEGRLLGFASGDKAGLAPQPPSSAAIWQVRLQQPWSRVEPTADGEGLVARAAVPVNLLSLGESVRVLLLQQAIPSQLARDAREVETAHSNYQELALSRIGLKRLYGFSLTLALALALFSAISLAFILSERMAAPLRALARGTRAVARGDFSQVQASGAQDELGMLTQSFNRMTRQLADARALAQENQDMLQEAKAYLESILGSVSTGVITLSPDYTVRTVNAAAAAALGVEPGQLIGRRLAELGEPGSGLARLAGEMEQCFVESGQGHWQGEMEYDSGNGVRVLLARGASLTSELDSDRLLAFDDITEMIRAQRDAAWGEVARRMAHEIKNPLTPIQLSAERLQRKLADKLDEHERQILTRSTETIVGQVAAMKGLVDAFAQYAKLPAARIEAVDLNALIREVLVLYEGQVPMQVMLADDLPPVAGDPALLRQVLHNLVKNAKEALVETAEPELRVATGLGKNGVELRVGDSGPGFPEHLLSRLFEPYATTKPKGTGLGLTIVKKIIDEHGGAIDVRNAQPHGACITITLPLMEGESADE
ncbi:multi-sensor signal transduction histidine kinase [Sulfuritortus calidifontis]|uniref:histidine kinase n=1 Tax=Sulfuritortus calidifontis TaxID=1914471 RepID=A0A4R3JTU6_9PROT|nr:ATP-binding protein [Sulfuritortus calidifontis]TCS69720.1 multi-sensor signal transduction histidine kinase [Sulfuritortus calidifontis]